MKRFLFICATLICATAVYAGGLDPQVQFSTGYEAETWKVYAAIAGSAIAGMLSNFLRRWLKGSIDGSLIGYLFTDNPKRTALAVFTLLGAVGTAVGMGQFDGITFKQIIMQAFLLGYASDTLNQGKPAAEVVGKT